MAAGRYSAKKEDLKIHDLSIKDVARKIKNDKEAETLLCELRRLGWVKSYVLKDTPAADLFSEFLKTFWD